MRTDKASGIVNGPNDFLHEQGRPDAIVDLIKAPGDGANANPGAPGDAADLEVPEVQS